MKKYTDRIVGGQKTGLLIFIGVFVIALLFAVYTSHIWEDFYITYRVSKNLATGHGMVYTIGEKVHAFTSPLNTLIPAALNVITGNISDELVLWLFRLISIAILGAAAVLLYKSARKNFTSLLPIAFLIGMFGMDAKIIDFSINGQEIAFMMLFLALTLNVLTVPSKWTGLKLGLAWAGLMWTRPDGFVYFVAIYLGFVLFNAGLPIGKTRLGLIKTFLFAGAIMSVLYLPWFLWVWHYFGSPIPHTITAKSLLVQTHSMKPVDLFLNFLTYPLSMLHGAQPTSDLFLSTYASHGGWHYTAYTFSYILSCTCAFYWCLPFGRPQGRAVSLALMLSLDYLSNIAPYIAPWYLPSCIIMAIFVFANILQQGLNLANLLKDKDEKTYRSIKRFISVVATFAVSVTLLLTVCTAYQLRVQQREIENGNRKEVGLWLRQNATSKADTVFLEPLGYIGFFSQLKMLDFPGICSPEVVAVRKKYGRNTWSVLISELKPEWLVLRPKEISTIQQNDPKLLTQYYKLIRTFDASDRLKKYRWLPGRNYLEYDQTFHVFRLNKNDTAIEKTNSQK